MLPRQPGRSAAERASCPSTSCRTGTTWTAGPTRPSSFDKLYSDIASDLGGDLTAVEKALVEGFCGATIVLQSLNTKLALGNAIDLVEFSSVCSSMVRIASKIGLSRRSRIVSGLVEAVASPPPSSPMRSRFTDAEEPA